MAKGNSVLLAGQACTHYSIADNFNFQFSLPAVALCWQGSNTKPLPLWIKQSQNAALTTAFNLPCTAQ